jgi:hypothetical protein
MNDETDKPPPPHGSTRASLLLGSGISAPDCADAQSRARFNQYGGSKRHTDLLPAGSSAPKQS